MNERDMMYSNFYQNIPGNISYGNFAYQGMPIPLMPIPNMIGNQYTTSNDNIITKINNLESRVKQLEQTVNKNITYEDNSLYML